METKNGNGLNWLLAGLIALSLIISTLGYFAIGNIKIELPNIPSPQVTNQDKSDIADLVISRLPSQPEQIEQTNEVNITSALSEEDRDYLRDMSSLDEEKKAEELALAELETKDFKKELMSFLNSVTVDENNETVEPASIDSYRDIKNIVVKDKEIDVSGNDGVVELEFKVYYYNDGDDDESDLQSAKVRITFEIDDLDSSEDYEDAEILDYSSSFELIKFYE